MMAQLRERWLRVRNWLLLRTLKRNDVFGVIYAERLWQCEESVSGTGSTLANTAAVREALPALLTDLGVTSMLDLPCGDCHWIREIDLGPVRYHGADIVPALVEENRARWQAPHVSFSTLDLCKDPLPAADLLLCRDALVHLSDRDLRAALRNIKRSGIRYLLTTSFGGPDRNNPPIQTGEWRPLNLQAAPWHFPAPHRQIDERYTGEDGRFADKSLALWRIDALPEL
jgi:hypothetical protein